MLAYVLGAHIIGAEQPVKRSPLRRGLDCRPALGFLPLHQANNPDNPHPRLARGLDGGYRRSAGGTNVIHYNHGRIPLLKTLNPPPGPMSLLHLPHQKTIQHR